MTSALDSFILFPRTTLNFLAPRDKPTWALSTMSSRNNAEMVEYSLMAAILGGQLSLLAHSEVNESRLAFL